MRTNWLVAAALALSVGCTGDKKDGDSVDDLPDGGYVVLSISTDTAGTTSTIAYAQFYTDVMPEDVEISIPFSRLERDACLALTTAGGSAVTFTSRDVGTMTITSATTSLALTATTMEYYVDDPPLTPGSTWDVTITNPATTWAGNVLPGAAAITAPSGSPATIPATGALAMQWTPMGSDLVVFNIRGYGAGQASRICYADDDGGGIL